MSNNLSAYFIIYKLNSLRSENWIMQIIQSIFTLDEGKMGSSEANLIKTIVKEFNL